MFIRKNKNRSGSISIQVVRKVGGKTKIVKTVGVTKNLIEVARLEDKAKAMIPELSGQTGLFPLSSRDHIIKNHFENLTNLQIQAIGPELIFGTLFDRIGLGEVNDELFRHLVIARLAHPTSKLGTIDYLYRYLGIHKEVDEIYRFLDELANKHQGQVERIIFNHTKQLLGGQIQVIFYDLTTLYFETESEDDLRKIGFSKDGKFRHPQIVLGLLTTTNGYPLGYELFEGNTFEGKTLIPAIQRLETKFELDRPVVVADAGLLSSKNLHALSKAGYEYILGARIKSESDEIKQQILDLKLSLQKPVGIISKILGSKKGQESFDARLIVSYSTARAKKDEHNRKKGLKRLEKRISSGKLTKSHISNRGYNKYLTLTGKMKVKINYKQFYTDKQWDGLKGYITNTKLKPETIIAHYSNLWLIEKAFRISKTDLRIRPIYHHKRNRIEAHLSIVFAAYAVYKELERLLKKHQVPLSIQKAAKLTHTMYQVSYTLPESLKEEKQILQMDYAQKLLYQVIHNQV